MIDLTNKRSLYHIYNKKKPNGKKRVIFAPVEELKLEQKELAKRLSAIYVAPSCVYGYVENKSIGDLAACHVGKDWIITIDLKDFFPSITKEMVLCLEGVSEYDAEIATFEDKCIQGSPCSPVISNMYMRDHDIMLNVLFSQLGVTYNRYSDDAQLSGFGKPSWGLVNILRSHLLNELKLNLNEKKIKFMFKNQRMEVLGICVNDKVSVDRKVRSQLKFRAKRDMLTVADRGMISYINGVMK